MEPFENTELSDGELDRMLPEWKTPPAPAGMRAAVFPERRVRWWQRSIRVPLPVAACVMLLLAAGAWRWVSPKRMEVPVPRLVRDGPSEVLTFRELRPVTELRPRIIGRVHAEN